MMSRLLSRLGPGCATVALLAACSAGGGPAMDASDPQDSGPPVRGPEGGATADRPGPNEPSDGRPADGARATDAAPADAPPGAGRPALCDNLPKLPVTYKVKRGPMGSEDFTFDREGNLISVDATSGNLFKTPFSGPPKLFASTRFMDAAGTRMLPNGDLVVAETEGGILYRVTPQGAKTPLASGFEYPNGIEIHLDGTIFVAEMNRGPVVKVNPTTGKSSVFVSIMGLDAPNGVSFSPDYKTLYVGDFWHGRVFAVELKPDGTAGTPRSLGATRIGERELDGMAVDECGNVYVDEYAAGKVWRITPRGVVSLAVDLSRDSEWIPNMQWGSGIGGWDPNILYVMDREKDVVYEVDLGVRGKRVAHLQGP